MGNNVIVLGETFDQHQIALIGFVLNGNDFLRKYLDDVKNSIFVHLISYFLVLTVSLLPIHIQAMQALIPNIAIQEKFHNQIVIGIKVIR